MAVSRKRNGRSSDFKFSWLVSERGVQWEEWRSLFERWILIQDVGVHHKMRALIWFVFHYLPLVPVPERPSSFLIASTHGILPDTLPILEERMNHSGAVATNNHIVEFLDWVIEDGFTEPDDHGNPVPLVTNQFSKGRYSSLKTETVYNSLPYSYVKELRLLLCPNPRGNFSDWGWAQAQSGQTLANGKNAGTAGDWFEVDRHIIDKNDPDCVWRSRFVKRGGKVREIHEIWSPVRSVALLVKLHLPLRVYQVRFLDSGEADTWRYEQGKWIENTKNKFSKGNVVNPWRRGIFSRLISRDTGEVMTGMYINTNKTADAGKDANERGYTIPWQNEDVLYWFEKLRNWQEKYNPIDAPTSCTRLKLSHFGFTKTEQQKKEMGDICFLFRDASSNRGGREFPISRQTIDALWYQLLSVLEDNVAERGQVLSDGSRLKFVIDYPEGSKLRRVSTEFPLHSLRVSLLTCYAMDGQVPIPVLSKLLAGHSRLIMGLYYTKPSAATVTRFMQEANDRLDRSEHDSLRTFLKDADLNLIGCKTAFNDLNSISGAVANRNAVGWEYRHIGLCLVGGNTMQSDEVSRQGGCWNGGELLNLANGGTYGPVPNGPENCVRCRWFITEASYLSALCAHFNNLSYRAALSAKAALELEQERDTLLEAQYFFQAEGRPFTRFAELQQLERRYERQIVEADELAKDLVSCFQLIGRLVSIEESRGGSEEVTKLVAVGSMSDVHKPISFIESDSELLQLSIVCQDAEVYPELFDALRKTPAIEKRSRILNRMLMSSGYQPVLMNMDEGMQMIAGNAMMRGMVKAASQIDGLEGFQKVTGIIEAGQSLGLIPKGVVSLEQKINTKVVKMSDLAVMSSKRVRELIDDRR